MYNKAHNQIRTMRPRVTNAVMPSGRRTAGYSGLLDIFTGYNSEEQQATSDSLDAQLAKLNDEARATGKIDQSTYDQTVAHIAQQVADTAAQPEQINQAFVDGVVEGYQNELKVLESVPQYAGKISGDVLSAVTKGTVSGVGSILGGVFGNIPWWMWVGGVAALFFYFGGGAVVSHQARKRIGKYAKD